MVLPRNGRLLTFHISGLGSGWEPALLDTEIEHDFIKESQKSFSNVQNYFIGGSADRAVNVTFVYREYSPGPPMYDNQRGIQT